MLFFSSFRWFLDCRLRKQRESTSYLGQRSCLEYHDLTKVKLQFMFIFLFKVKFDFVLLNWSDIVLEVRRIALFRVIVSKEPNWYSADWALLTFWLCIHCIVTADFFIKSSTLLRSVNIFVFIYKICQHMWSDLPLFTFITKMEYFAGICPANVTQVVQKH